MLLKTTIKKKKPQWDIISHLLEGLEFKKRQQTTSASEDIEKQKPYKHYWWEYKLVQPLWETVWQFFKKLKMQRLYDLAILPLSIYPKEMKIGY